MENKLGIIKQVKLLFTTSEAWLKIRTKAKDSKCGNCGKLHKEEEYIAFATVEGRVNAHICQECGKYFIEQGAENIDNLQTNYKITTEILKEKAKKLNIYGIDEMDNEQLEEAILKTEKEHKEIEERYEDNTAIQSLIKELGITIVDFYYGYFEYLYEYDEIINRDEHRWWDEITVVQKVNDKYFEYVCATANGDKSIKDLGWEFSFSSIKEVKQVKKMIEIIEYI